MTTTSVLAMWDLSKPGQQDCDMIRGRSEHWRALLGADDFSQRAASISSTDMVAATGRRMTKWS